jgi:hydrogenase maturation protease
LRGDDGVGPRVVERLRAEALAADVELRDLHAPGIDLLLYLDGVDTLIVVDACATTDAPGTVCTLDKEALFALPIEPGANAHQPSLLDTLRLARTLASEPRRVFLVGVAARGFELGAAITPEVEAAVEEAVRAVLQVVDPNGPDCVSEVD